MATMKRSVAVAWAFAVGSVVAGESVTIELQAVPEPILQAATRAMPNAHFHSANTEQEAAGLVYEIQGKTADGRALEVDVLESGQVEEIEVEFTRDLVPGAVLKAVEHQYPGFKIEFIEASHSASKKVIQYEFVGTMGGKQLDLEVSADGRRIVEADD
ncbi:MAG: hypothetical protein VYA55_05280 [Pseudomonadota bacterium]|nr:hypothetical protein [Pseudomonadota bacterium]